jgi:general secretion pathway protein L
MRIKLLSWWVVGDFLGWWIAELRATMASLLEALRIKDSTRLFLYVEGEGLTVRQVQRSKAQDLCTLTRDSAGRWPLSLEADDSSREFSTFSGSTLTAVLPASDVLIRMLVLPAAAEKSLDRVLAIQTVREFPLAPTQLYFDHRIVQRLRDTKQIVVHLRAAKRTQIDELSTWALSAGGRLERICCMTADGEISGNFLPRASWGVATRFSTLERGFAVASLFLLAAAAGIVGAQWWFERRHVDTDLTKVRVEAQQVRARWKQIETDSAPVTELIKLMSRPDAASVLGDLPDRLPTDTWVSQIEIRAPATAVATVSLSAFAPAAVTLVDELAKSIHFQHVHLIYAASDSFSNHGDRVQLSAEWIAAGEASRTLMMPMPPQGRSP